MYSLMAVTFQQTLYPTERMDWILEEFTKDIAQAVQFKTKEEAIDFAVMHCNLYVEGAHYEWFVIEHETEAIVAQFIRAPQKFLTVSGLYHWLSNLLPYEEIGQEVEGIWHGVTCVVHEEIKRVEIQPVERNVSAAELQHELKHLPGDWEIFDLHTASEDWQLSVNPIGFRKWELACYVKPAYKGFVSVEHLLPSFESGD